jgi:hypothetical protein
MRAVAIAAVLCAGLVAWAYWRNPSHVYDAASLVQTLPPDKAVHAYVDLALLRRGGYLDLLAGSKATEEADYKKFVEDTGFDYRTDLDAAALAFRNSSVYAAARGKFDWLLLERYAAAHGGHCQDALCAMPASTPGRAISFYRMQPNVLALAVAPDERGAAMIGPLHWKTPPRIPPAGLWVSAPPFVFSDVNALPAGSHSFLSPLAQTQGVTFALGAGPGENLELRMEASSATPAAAADLAKRLTTTTDLLARMLKRDKMTPNAGDLSGVLVAGRFAAKDSSVTGMWPIERRFLESLLSGKVK